MHWEDTKEGHYGRGGTKEMPLACLSASTESEERIDKTSNITPMAQYQ
jgi:hypothetical protein